MVDKGEFQAVETKTDTRFIFISGGVVSGLGKGITTSSLSMLFQSRGFTVSTIKCDMYVNVDAGTMNPTEHGEVFVTEDGIEADQDLGQYERYLNKHMSKRNYTTTGQVYASLIQKERELSFDGRCVEVVPHIPEEIISRMVQASDGAEFTFVELGGTVGEYQSVLFLEATRMLSKRLSGRTVHVHVSYFPFLENIGELKSKPTQLSIRKLNECGIVPDFVVARSSRRVDAPRFNTLCQNSNLTPDEIIFSPDLASIYEVPLVLEEQRFAEKILKKLGMSVVPRAQLSVWKSRLDRMKAVAEKRIKVGMVAKYHNVGDYSLADSYVSVLEALNHAGIDAGGKPEIVWIDAQDLNENNVAEELGELDGIIVPQGWGARGSEGKIQAIRHARTTGMPYLGLCYGMQMAAIEFARHIGIEGANSLEVDKDAAHPVIYIMPDQEKYLRRRLYGGTIRLGAYPCRLTAGSRLHAVYGKDEVQERHRHRYEFNNEYRQQFEKAGMVFSGLSPDGNLVEAIELPDHPFFIGVQFHPEYKSAFVASHPLFCAFLKACKGAK